MNREVVSTPNAPAAIGPYSQGIKAEGRLLFLSGQVALTPAGDLVMTSVADQTKQVIANINNLLESQGLTAANVVKTTIFLSSMDHFQTVNEVYKEFFAVEPPARSTVAVLGLPKGVDVEIETIAVY